MNFLWRRAFAAGFAGLIATSSFGCRKGEAPGASAAPQGQAAKKASPTAQQPTEPSAPQIRETAATDRAPYTGMKEPRDAALDSQGRLWVADFGNSRLRIFDAKGGYLGGWGNRGNGTFELRDPCAVTVHGEDVYVADTWNGRIQKFSIAGEWKATAAGLFGPRGVAAAPDGSVWATDTGNNRVVVYDAALASPRMIGKEGSGPAEFAGPVGIAVGASGAVYVADTRNRRIQVLGLDGGFRRALSIPGWEGSSEPHVEVGDDGEVYVTDPNAAKVLDLTSSGQVRRSWVADEAGKPFARPTGLALDRQQGILYVVDSANNTVSKVLLARAKNS